MANKIYTARETAHTWTDSTGDSAITIANLATVTGRVGAQWDRGAGSLAGWFEWRLVIAGFATSPVVGETVDLYFATSDGTNEDGNVGTADAALADTDALTMLRYAGSAVVISTTTTDDLIVSGVIFLPSRYIIPVVYNSTADNLENTSNVHSIILTPIPDELQ